VKDNYNNFIEYKITQNIKNQELESFQLKILEYKFQEIYLRCKLFYKASEVVSTHEALKIFNFHYTYHIELLVENAFYLKDQQRHNYSNPKLINKTIFTRTLSDEKFHKKIQSGGFASSNNTIGEIVETYKIKDQLVFWPQIKHLDSSISPPCNLSQQLKNYKYDKWRVIETFHENESYIILHCKLEIVPKFN
jgi:hypothetical protein